MTNLHIGSTLDDRVRRTKLRHEAGNNITQRIWVGGPKDTKMVNKVEAAVIWHSLSEKA